MQRQFYFKRVEDQDGIVYSYEKVEEEEWQWMAIYNDGNRLYQFDIDHEIYFPDIKQFSFTFHQFVEIDQQKLVEFRMVNRQNPARFYALHFDHEQGMKLIHKYQRGILNAFTPEEVKYTKYLFGYEKKINGFTHKFINVILPDGNLVSTWDADLINLGG